MKRVDFYYFLTLSLILVALFGLPNFKSSPSVPPVASMSKEELASHRLVLQDESEKELGVCTGTAIAPHAILTAEHCLQKGLATKLSLDESFEVHKIIAIAGDGTDHVILLMDGSPFRNIEIVTSAHAEKKDVVTIFGVGGDLYPPAPKYGVVISCDDPSDIDADADMRCYTIPAIPGDSGSAVYNKNGEIVGLLSYADNGGSAGFELHFNQEVLDIATSFSGKLVKK